MSILKETAQAIVQYRKRIDKLESGIELFLHRINEIAEYDEIPGYLNDDICRFEKLLKEK